MSTHKSTCRICGKETYCSSDESALGLSGGCFDPKDTKIEFCSVRCFNRLIINLADRIEVVKQLMNSDDLPSEWEIPDIEVTWKNKSWQSLREFQRRFELDEHKHFASAFRHGTWCRYTYTEAGNYTTTDELDIWSLGWFAMDCYLMCGGEIR